MLGLGSIVLGITCIVSELGDFIPSLSAMKANSLWILLGGCVVGAIIIGISTSKMVKKEQK